jgi:hypothetical protein
MVPTLSLSASGNGDMVSVTIYGDAYANAILYYQKAGYGMQSQYLGTTNANGYFSTTVSTSGDGISTGSYVYVVVNNQQSSQTLWPYNYNNGYNNYGSQLSLSQTSISLNAGASANVTVYGSGSYYISSNTNSNIASANISGNNVSIYGVAYGSDTISICQSGGQCASLYVTVNYNGTNYNNYGYQTAITFSQNNPTLSIGQNTSVSIFGGTGSGYYVAYNSNSSGIQANISGNILNITGETNSIDAITVCSVSTNCSALTVNVGYYNTPIVY